MMLLVKKIAIKIAGLLMGVILLFGGVLAYEIHSYLHSPVAGNQEQLYKIITIPKGAGFNQVLQILVDHQLVALPGRFRLLAKYRKAFTQIKAGEFRVQTDWTPIQMLDHLLEGRSQLHKITIPEGLTFEQVVIRLAEANLGKLETFRDLQEDLRLRQAVDISPTVPSLEGFLFPETYFFSKTDSEFDILKTMVKQFNQNYQQIDRQQAQSFGLSDYEMIILASIIEKETGREKDRTLISAVFHNRLKRRMRLESDPTVIYGIKNFDGNLTRKHLKTPTLYNTYTNFGLPPGPICNPGKSSIQSTLFPAEVPYLFFVSKGDGSSYFSSNLKSHNQAVRKYQKNRKYRLKMQQQH
ncbi:MAG: endolytic transglycosylase MltG [SAR324 cluster bacterium]|nr:endolytic transglycosylase MltG [SAR324 cluster bacterium]